MMFPHMIMAMLITSRYLYVITAAARPVITTVNNIATCESKTLVVDAWYHLAKYLKISNDDLHDVAILVP